eukprot:3929309-Amphidinium_carterae.3
MLCSEPCDGEPQLIDNDEDDKIIAAVARKWLIDTGSAYDLVSTKDAVEDPKKFKGWRDL